MDLTSIDKQVFRDRIMRAYTRCSGNTFVPRDEYLFTLGGPCAKDGKLIKDCELDSFTSRSIHGQSFLLPHQYVSVERNRKIHNDNVKLSHYFGVSDGLYGQKPHWIRGEIEVALGEWLVNNERPIAIVNADFMCGIDVAFPKIEDIVFFMADSATPKCGGALLVFNVIVYNQLHDVKYHQTYSEARPKFSSLEKDGTLELVNWSRYQSKTVGIGSRSSSVMETLMYWY